MTMILAPSKSPSSPLSNTPINDPKYDFSFNQLKSLLFNCNCHHSNSTIFAVRLRLKKNEIKRERYLVIYYYYCLIVVDCRLLLFDSNTHILLPAALVARGIHFPFIMCNTHLSSAAKAAPSVIIVEWCIIIVIVLHHTLFLHRVLHQQTHRCSRSFGSWMIGTVM